MVFWRLDRFSREGALATLKYLKELARHGVAYKSFTEPYLDSLGPFGAVIVSMLATIAAQDLIKIRENTKAALDKKEDGRRHQAGGTYQKPAPHRQSAPAQSGRGLEPSHRQGPENVAQHRGQVLGDLIGVALGIGPRITASKQVAEKLLFSVDFRALSLLLAGTMP